MNFLLSFTVNLHRWNKLVVIFDGFLILRSRREANTPYALNADDLVSTALHIQGFEQNGESNEKDQSSFWLQRIILYNLTCLIFSWALEPQRQPRHCIRSTICSQGGGGKRRLLCTGILVLVLAKFN